MVLMRLRVVLCPESEEEEAAEDLLKPGHLSRLLEEELAGELGCLALGEVSAALEQLLNRLATHRETCPPQQLHVRAHTHSLTYTHKQDRKSVV